MPNLEIADQDEIIASGWMKNETNAMNKIINGELMTLDGSLR